MSEAVKPEYDRIWLEPREDADPYIGRQWCQDNQWGEEGVEYVRADVAGRDLLAASKALITQWESPNWKLTEPTAKLMNDLHDAISKAESSS